jgi:signal transduction histidine kinase
MTAIDINPYFEALQKGQPARFMMNTISRETGRQAVFEISTYPSTQGIIIIVEDKTEEETTKRLSAIGQTAGMVGHDIRNPLQAILSDVFLLKGSLKTMPDNETKNEVEESLDSIEKNIGYINKIVQDLQDYARPLTVTAKEIKIIMLFDEILVDRAIPQNIQVIRAVEPDASEICGDSDLLKRILANLVNNAVQAMPNGGKLTLHSYCEVNDFVISVQDTGVGIPEDIKPKIFAPLFTTKSKGQGFGLAVVKRMTEALGGTVTFESEPNKGTKFMIHLPHQQITQR